MDWRHEHELASGGGNSNKQSRKLLAGRILDWADGQSVVELARRWIRQTGRAHACVRAWQRTQSSRALRTFLPSVWGVTSPSPLLTCPINVLLVLATARFWAARASTGAGALCFLSVPFHSTPLTVRPAFIQIQQASRAILICPRYQQHGENHSNRWENLGWFFPHDQLHVTIEEKKDLIWELQQ
jgi:hypothetical protein